MTYGKHKLMGANDQMDSVMVAKVNAKYLLCAAISLKLLLGTSVKSNSQEQFDFSGKGFFCVFRRKRFASRFIVYVFIKCRGRFYREKHRIDSGPYPKV